MPEQNITKTGTVDSYKVNISGTSTRVRVRVDGRNYETKTNNSEPGAFTMASITCLKDAFLQGRQVTVVGWGDIRPSALLSLKSIKLHK